MSGRKTITVKLHHERDADLIEWWDGLPRGDWTGETDSRQRTVKSILRAAIGLPLPPSKDAAPPSAVIEDLYNALDNIAAELERAKQQPNNHDGERVAALEQYVTSQLNEVATHINALYRRVESIGSPIIDQTPIDSTPRADDQKLQQRRENRKKNSW